MKRRATLALLVAAWSRGCGPPSPPPPAEVDGAAARAELACLIEEGLAALPAECDSLDEVARLGDETARRLLARAASDSAAAGTAAVPFPPGVSPGGEPPPFLRLRPRAPALGWRLASPFPRGVALVVEDEAAERVARVLFRDAREGSRLLDWEFSKLLNYFMGTSALDRTAETRLLVLADERARWDAVRALLEVASVRFPSDFGFERPSFARAALLPSPRGDLARPIAVHDALRIAEALARAPEDLAIGVRLGPSAVPVFEIGTVPASLEAIRRAVAAGSGRVLLGAAPDVPMALVMDALDAALAGRLSRPLESRPDIEIEGGR